MLKLASNPKAIYLIGIILSLILTISSVLQSPIFNPDGILYLTVAKTYLANGYSAAADIYNWPFYACLIGKTSAWLHLSLLNTAYTLNFIFFSGLVCFFIKLVEQLGGSIKVQWFALLMVVFFHPVNKYLHQIVRDNGYWCLMLLSAILLIRFSKSLRWIDAILWGAITVLATLFRIEGGVMLLLLPFSILIFTELTLKKRLNAWVKLNVATIVGGVLLFFIHKQHHLAAVTEKSRLKELSQYLHSGPSMLLSHFNELSQKMADFVLIPQYADMAKPLLLFGLIGVYVWLVLTVLTLPHVINVSNAFLKKHVFNKIAHRIIFFYLLINVIITFAFTAINFYFDTRYYKLLCLFLLLYAPFGFAYLYHDVRQNPKNKFKVILFVVMLISWLAMIISSVVHIGPSKRYIYDATQWVEKNTPTAAHIYTNIGQLPFLTDRESTGFIYDSTAIDWNQLNSGGWRKNSQYVILNMQQDKNELGKLVKIIGSNPVIIFQGSRPKKQVAIFKSNL